MKKFARIISSILICSLTLSTLAACSTNESTSSPESEESKTSVDNSSIAEASKAEPTPEESKAEESSEPEESSKPETHSKFPEINPEIIPAPNVGLRTDSMKQQSNPLLYGDFIQDWFCRNWSLNQWKAHFADLRAAGIKSLILQMGFETNLGKISNINYENDFKDEDFAPNCVKSTFMLGRVLEAAKEYDCTVWIGLGHTGEWWKPQYVGQDKWREHQSKLNQIAMKSVVDHYYKEYKDQIEGFYWTYEMFTNNNGYDKYWLTMLNSDLDFLTSLNTGLPLMIAPFNSGYEIAHQGDKNTAKDDYKIFLTPAKAKDIWKEFFKNSHFRKGDVFCPQDCMYSQKLKEADALDYLIAMYEAMTEVKPEMRFWADVESFTPEFYPADINRYIRQLNICCKFAEKCVGFSYSHYYAIASRSKTGWKESARNTYIENAKKYLVNG